MVKEATFKGCARCRRRLFTWDSANRLERRGTKVGVVSLRVLENAAALTRRQRSRWNLSGVAPGSQGRRGAESLVCFHILVKKSNICAAGVDAADGTSANKYWRKRCGGILLIDAVLLAF